LEEGNSVHFSRFLPNNFFLKENSKRRSSSSSFQLFFTLSQSHFKINTQLSKHYLKVLLFLSHLCFTTHESFIHSHYKNFHNTNLWFQTKNTTCGTEKELDHKNLNNNLGNSSKNKNLELIIKN